MPIVLSIILSAPQIETIQLTNKKKNEFCELNLKKKAGTEECWDLVVVALYYAHADWQTLFNFGKEIDSKSQALFPEDVIQFDKVRVERPDGTWSVFPNHFAIVYRVLDKENIIMVHQNHNGAKRLDKFEMNLQQVVKGTIIYYRLKVS